MKLIRVEQDIYIAVYDLNSNAVKTAVLLSGWPFPEKVFEYQKDMLLNTGYRVMTMDFRGFGNSTVPAGGYSYDRLAADFYQVVKALNLNAFVLAGFSLGAAVSLRYMRKYKGYGVQKLCLLAPPAPGLVQREDFPHGVTRNAVQEVIRLASLDRPLLCRKISDYFFYNKQSGEMQDWIRYLALSSSGIGTVQTAFSMRDEDCRTDLAAVRVPTGIFHGEKDRIIPYELSVKLKESIESAELIPFADSGHGIIYDELEHFNRELFRFLEANN